MLTRLYRSQEGQAIGLIPVVAILLIVAIFFVYNIGNYYYAYMREQNAIDAAAYSGAAMQADALNMIVILNKGLFTIYGLGITICLVAIVAGLFTGGSTACPICRGAGYAMKVTERAALATMTMINRGSVAFAAAAMNIYKQSKGKANLPNYGAFVSTLKLDKVYCNNFLWPGCAPFFFPKKTYMGMVEKKTKGIYDWAGGKISKPHVYGTFGRPKKGNAGGRYDKKGPGAVAWTKVPFTPATSWFKKFKKNIILVSQARPYGGYIGTITQKQSYKRKETRKRKYLDITTGEWKEKDESESYNKTSDQAFTIPWGKASFKSKLVVTGY